MFLFSLKRNGKQLFNILSTTGFTQLKQLFIHLPDIWSLTQHREDTIRKSQNKEQRIILALEREPFSHTLTPTKGLKKYIKNKIMLLYRTISLFIVFSLWFRMHGLYDKWSLSGTDYIIQGKKIADIDFYLALWTFQKHPQERASWCLPSIGISIWLTSLCVCPSDQQKQNNPKSVVQPLLLIPLLLSEESISPPWKPCPGFPMAAF